MGRKRRLGVMSLVEHVDVISLLGLLIISLPVSIFVVVETLGA